MLGKLYAREAICQGSYMLGKLYAREAICQGSYMLSTPLYLLAPLSPLPM